MVPHVPGHIPKFLDKQCHPPQAWFLWFCMLPDFSWWSCHLLVSHPSIILSHPIHCCSLANVSSVPAAGILSLTHCSSCDIISIRTFIAMPFSFIHLLSFCRLSVHCARALTARQQTICVLSSILLVWHQGQATMNHWPCCIIFFPCAKCPVMCFVTHLLWPGMLSLNALSIACRSSSLWRCLTSGSLFAQYFLLPAHRYVGVDVFLCQGSLFWS